MLTRFRRWGAVMLWFFAPAVAVAGGLGVEAVPNSVAESPLVTFTPVLVPEDASTNLIRYNFGGALLFSPPPSAAMTLGMAPDYHRAVEAFSVVGAPHDRVADNQRTYVIEGNRVLGVLNRKTASFENGGAAAQRTLHLAETAGADLREMKSDPARHGEIAPFLAKIFTGASDAPATLAAKAPPVVEGPLPLNSPERDGPVFMRVQGREYVMGSPRDEQGRSYDEPQRSVQVPSFMIAKTLTTRGQYYQIMDPEKFRTMSLEERHLPITDITQYDAKLYAIKLALENGEDPYYALDEETVVQEDGHIVEAVFTVLGGNGPRLPEDSEWELAARGADHKTSEPYPFPVDRLDEYAHYDSNTVELQPVATKKPVNGLYDMQGLVYEWTDSRYNTGSGRVVRGGSWTNRPPFLRSALRREFDPDYRGPLLGLRLARSVGEP